MQNVEVALHQRRLVAKGIFVRLSGPGATRRARFHEMPEPHMRKLVETK